MNKYWVSYQANERIEAETLEEAEEKMEKILQERKCYFHIFDIKDDGIIIDF